jgi:putative Holliday junction resolvase
MARVVGLDVGERRIGIAISDATRTLARPVGTVRIASLDQAAAVIGRDIDRFAREEDGVDTVVVGLPRRLDGSANEMTARVEAFAAQLRQRTGQAVVLQDERLSSIEAESRLASREKDWRVRKARLDSAAAAVILQDYLDGEVKS